MRGTRSVIGALAVAALLAGCGGGGSSNGNGNGGSSGNGGLTKSQLQHKADQICAKHKSQITAAAQKLLAGGKLPTPKKFGKFANGVIIPQTQQQVQQLQQLNPPSSIAGRYHGWISDLQSLIQTMKQNPVAIQSAKTFAKVNQEAKQLGLSSACQGGPGG